MDVALRQADPGLRVELRLLDDARSLPHPPIHVSFGHDRYDVADVEDRTVTFGDLLDLDRGDLVGDIVAVRMNYLSPTTFSLLTQRLPDGTRSPKRYLPLSDKCKLPFQLATDPDQQPRYLVLSRTHTAAGLPGGEHFLSWASLLAHAGAQLHRFRASRNTPGVRYQPEIKTPEWLDVVHKDGPEFGLGALGLTVVFREGHVVNAHDRRSREILRRPSPLWLRPVGGDRHWRLLSYAFRGQFLPDTAEVRLDHRSRRVKVVTVTATDVTARTDAWINNLRDDVDLTER